MYPYLLLILVVIFYAGNILVGKAVSELPPITITFFRLLVAFVFMLPFGARRAWASRDVFMRHKKPLLLMTITGITLFNTFIYGALQFTTSTNVGVLESTVPVATAIFSAVFINEKLRRRQWVGVLLSLFGALWVVLDGRLTQLVAMAWNVGDVIMIGAIVCWAIYSIAIKEYMHLFPLYGALLVMSGISVVLLFPVLIVEWLFTGIPAFLQPDLAAGLLYLGIFPSFIALVFYNQAVDMLTASRAAVFLNFLPVGVMIGAYFWFDEIITWGHITGVAVVIGGVTLTTQSGDKTLPKEKDTQHIN